MIEIRLYGKLRNLCALDECGQDGVICLHSRPDETVASLLQTLGSAYDQIYTVFLNHRLLAAHSNMARWMGHQRVGPNPLHWNLNYPITGDRIGFFGRDMAALVV